MASAALPAELLNQTGLSYQVLRNSSLLFWWVFSSEREAPRKVSLVRIGRTILHDLQTIWIVMIRDLYRICTMAKSYIAKHDLGAHEQSVCFTRFPLLPDIIEWQGECRVHSCSKT